MYYYKARFYNPRLGRFLQTDPAGTKDDLNLYAYVGNNPVNRVDPTGLAKVELGGAIQVAASTASPDFAAKMLGYDRKTFGAMIHVMKADLKLGPADNVKFMDNGDVMFGGVVRGNMHDYGN